MDTTSLPAPDDEDTHTIGRKSARRPHIELITREACHGERNAQSLGMVFLARDALDIVGRIAVGRFRDAIERPLNVIESKQEGT